MQTSSRLTDASVVQFPTKFRRFVELIGVDRWRERAEMLNRRCQDQPFLDSFVRRRFALELELGRLLEQAGRAGGILPVDGFDPVHSYRLIAFVMIFQAMWERSSKADRADLKNHLLRAVGDPAVGLAPIEHELSTASHLAHRGLSIHFPGNTGGKRPDLLASNGSQELAVECKLITGDLGRALHEEEVGQICDAIVRRCGSLITAFPDDALIRLVLLDSLGHISDPLQVVANNVAEALLGHEVPVHDTPAEVQVSTLPRTVRAVLSSHQEPVNLSALRTALEQAGTASQHVGIIMTERDRRVVIAVAKLRADRVEERIRQTLLKAARDQLPTDRPGLLAARLDNLTAQELIELAADQDRAPNALQRIATAIFLDKRCNHVLGVAFTAPGKIEQRRIAVGSTFMTQTVENGAAYYFETDRPPAGLRLTLEGLFGY